jgi:uncharacterized membrane protein YhaH (DUF805 family)
MNYENLYVNAGGKTSREHFTPALIVVVLAIAFFWFLVGGRTAQFCILTLLYPAHILLARRLRDMGRSAWLVLIPAILLVLMFAIRLKYFSLGASMDQLLQLIALLSFAAIAAWGLVGKQYLR